MNRWSEKGRGWACLSAIKLWSIDMLEKYPVSHLTIAAKPSLRSPFHYGKKKQNHKL